MAEAQAYACWKRLRNRLTDCKWHARGSWVMGWLCNQLVPHPCGQTTTCLKAKNRGAVADPWCFTCDSLLRSRGSHVKAPATEHHISGRGRERNASCAQVEHCENYIDWHCQARLRRPQGLQVGRHNAIARRASTGVRLPSHVYEGLISRPYYVFPYADLIRSWCHEQPPGRPDEGFRAFQGT